MTLRRTLQSGIIALFSCAVLMPAQAKLPDRDDWRWFEVEVLLFKHTVEQDINEVFPTPVSAIRTEGAHDLLTPYINRSYRALLEGLDACMDWPELSQFRQFDWRFDCRLSDENQWIPIPGNPLAPKPRIAALEQTDVVINGSGGDIHTASAPFLMPASSHVLTETRTELERKALAKPLLHLAWRQPVFTKDENYQLRLFGGKQFTESFRYDGFSVESGLPTPQATDSLPLLERVDQLINALDNGKTPFHASEQDLPEKLEGDDLPDNVWELDGLLHIFLIGNYLHIDNNFNLREADIINLRPSQLQQQAQWVLHNKDVQQPFLRAYPFDQLRRVISHETHYFDHPKIGMVIQIRRTDLSARRY